MKTTISISDIRYSVIVTIIIIINNLWINVVKNNLGNKNSKHNTDTSFRLNYGKMRYALSCRVIGNNNDNNNNNNNNNIKKSSEFKAQKKCEGFKKVCYCSKECQKMIGRNINWIVTKTLLLLLLLLLLIFCFCFSNN